MLTDFAQIHEGAVTPRAVADNVSIGIKINADGLRSQWLGHALPDPQLRQAVTRSCDNAKGPRRDFEPKRPLIAGGNSVKPARAFANQAGKHIQTPG